MKKIVSAILAAILCMGMLAGCGSVNKEEHPLGVFKGDKLVAEIGMPWEQAEKNLGKEAEEIREGYLRNEDIEIICNNGIVSTIALDTGKYSDYQGNRVGKKCIYDPRATEPGLIFLQRYSTDMEEITEENENEKEELGYAMHFSKEDNINVIKSIQMFLDEQHKVWNN